LIQDFRHGVANAITEYMLAFPELPLYVVRTNWQHSVVTADLVGQGWWQMIQIDPELLQQVRETADWFTGLPRKLVVAVMGSRGKT
jgi:hypothetical protein